MSTSDSPGTELKFSLEIGKGYAPFALSAADKRLGPEDWAWRFLRLNKKYQDAYALAVEKQTANPKSWAGRADYPDIFNRRTVRTDEAICREKFGLSTWLDPDLCDLPALGKKDEIEASWFAPLKSVIAYPESIRGLDHNANEELFGFRSWKQSPTLHHRLVEIPRRNAMVWFPIDCSVPPKGQLASVSFICEQFALQLRYAGHTSRHIDAPKGPLLTHLIGSNICDPRCYQKAFGGTDDLKNKPEVWRMIGIDVLGKTAAQIKKASSSLAKEHGDLVEAGRAKGGHEKFWTNLAWSTGRAFGQPTDGHRLKGFVILAECADQGVSDPKDILDVLARNGAGSNLPRNLSIDWIYEASPEVRGKRFEDYMVKAKLEVEEGYKWLIHLQRPAPCEAD